MRRQAQNQCLRDDGGGFVRPRPSGEASAAGLPRPVPRGRRGKVLVLFAIILPVLIGVVGLVVDGGLLMAKHRNLQHFADIAATAAAMDLLRGEPTEAAVQTANWQVYRNHVTGAAITVNIPPSKGAYAGNPRFVEVILSQPVESYFMQVLGADAFSTVRAESIAGYEPVTDGAAVVVLESDPPAYTIPGNSPLYPSLAASTAGLEIGGSGDVWVDGAILVNTQWGSIDENGLPAGDGPGPPFGIRCKADHVHAPDVRVTGGVDAASNYRSSLLGGHPPLTANRFPVPDPLEDLPVPTTTADSNVKATYYGAVTTPQIVTGETRLSPGVYDWIDVPYGYVHFLHGVYIIRGVNPDTGIALNVRGNNVDGEEVMFYITDSADYSASTGEPDAEDTGSTPEEMSSAGLPPSVVIDVGAASRFTHLNDIGRGAGPYGDMLIFQRRNDRRPIIIRRPLENSTSYIRGTVYSKSGHVIYAAGGPSGPRFVAGSMRIINLGSCRIAPSKLLPPAEDVFLVQ